MNAAKMLNFHIFTIGVSEGGARDAPPGSKFFHFHAVFGKQNGHTHFGSCPPPRKIFDPPLFTSRNYLCTILFFSGNGAKYFICNGTSFSSPHAAAVAAHVLVAMEAKKGRIM